jgi:hypothetical protein
MIARHVGQPRAANPHIRIERGMGKQVCSTDTAPLTANGQS